MPSVTIDPELYKRMQNLDVHNQPDGLVNEAVRRYLWELDQDKISRETAFYRAEHAKLKIDYLGKYIAMQNGRVVDHDADFAVLRKRVRAKYGRSAVMMTLVEETSDPEIIRRGFREG